MMVQVLWLPEQVEHKLAQAMEETMVNLSYPPY
jgi:hypothetical protein